MHINIRIDFVLHVAIACTCLCYALECTFRALLKNYYICTNFFGRIPQSAKLCIACLNIR